MATDRNFMRNQVFAIKDIYVPTARRKTLNLETVRALAESMLEVGQTTPIHVRADGARYVLVEGLHRLEAAKELGETTIIGLLVQARRH
jgi:ParB-like chromosome segregation protein Spo0J